MPPSEINPYASPQGPPGYDADAFAGIGAWRDGDSLVLHRSATLPPVCIETGQPARQWRRFGLLWSYPIDWSTRRLWLQLPLCDREYRRHINRRRLFAALLMTPLLAALWADAFPGQRSGAVVTIYIALCIFGPLAAGALWWS